MTKTISEIIYPARIAESSGVQFAERLLVPDILQIGLNETNCAECAGGSYIILDFGKELSGGLRILNFTGNGNIRVRLGESLAETCAELGEDGACNDHSTRDATVFLNNYSDMEFMQSGFRFARIDFPTGEPFKIKKIVAVYTHADLEQAGRFECSDSLVNDRYLPQGKPWTRVRYRERLPRQAAGYVPS